MQNFSQSSVSICPENEISIYTGDIISDESIVKYSMKIRFAFPALHPDFYGVLLEMAKEEGFTDERFRDAVTNVIKTCIYPTPTIAQFISFDRRFKVYRYHEYSKLVEDGANGADYKAIQFPDREKLVWVHVDDIKKYNLKSENSK